MVERNAVRVLALLLIGLSAGGPFRCLWADDAPGRPNFIVVYTDDQRFDAVGANGNSLIRTPHLDQLSARGVRFTNAYVVMSLCSPSRAALLTGRYGSGNGVVGLDQPLRPGERTFAHALREAGYQTALVGKWHLATRVPDAGFDFRCYFQGNGDYFHRRVWDNDHFVTPEQHLDEYCTQRSIDFLTQAAESDQPFVLFHSTQLPHMNHEHVWPSAAETRAGYDDTSMPLPATWNDDLSGKPDYLTEVRNRTQALTYGYDQPESVRRHVADYYSVVTDMDMILGRLLDTVESLGLWHNTYVVFMSDNGWLLGEHGFTSKVLPYEPSVRVPLTIAGPGLRPGVVDRLALNIDIAPTLLELAGLPISDQMHGQSLVPLLQAAPAAWRDSFVYECVGGYGGTRPLLAAISPRWKLVHTWNAAADVVATPPSFVELYDLLIDPDETRNLCDEPYAQTIRKELALVLQDHIDRQILPAQSSTMERLAAGAGASQFSGIYPHLASFNSQGECGTGAVVPWADMLWWITYSPHMPDGSDDRLYVANKALDLFAWSASVGGTPANRMIHRESEQLLIGPYLIDRQHKIRVIPPSVMRGRLTGTARHLVEPANKVYYATMEEGFYEVDIRSLAVTELFPDGHETADNAGTLLQGYHGKGFYSGQGVIVYANNGEKGEAALTRPDTPSGVLAEWPGSGPWTTVLRNQFTEVSGPGGIHGNENPADDPVWSIGWDHRSLILMLRDGGTWHKFRLPKASHCYDGAHGWNTEWPRIREIGEQDLLMTMHGTFWRFPSSFRWGQAAGIEPRSTYLKVIGDFCRWDDHVVFGCDDAAQNEFLNTRKAKGKVAGPVQSQSNLWFVEPSRLDNLGPTLGRGALWLEEAVSARTCSEPFLFHGYASRSVHLVHNADRPVAFHFEVDRTGDGTWTSLEDVVVPAAGYVWHPFTNDAQGQWVRVTVDTDCQASVWFEMRNPDRRQPSLGSDDGRLHSWFTGMSHVENDLVHGGLVRAGGRDTGLKILATSLQGGVSELTGYYELKPDLSLIRVETASELETMAREVAIPQGVFRLVGRSVLYIDDDEQRYRLPIGNQTYLQHPQLLDIQRASREVVTERDLFQCAGTFYELPARNAGGLPKIRPIATHPLLIQDYCSWRGLLVLTGISPEAANDNPHVLRSSDGKCAVWLGAVDDLWDLGKPVGRGGPWTDEPVTAGQTSDPYLMAGFDRKRLTLSHDAAHAVSFTLEVDINGTGLWQTFCALEVPSGQPLQFEFPAGFEAYWVRLTVDRDCQATAEFVYE